MTSDLTIKATALWYLGGGRAELRQEGLAAPGPADVQVRTLFSAISRGTERLVFAGRVPASEFERMRAPFMGGSFPAPVKYGYASVGRVESGSLSGQTVFALYPHQSDYVVPLSSVVLVPDGVPPARAVLAANMETALNAVWDGAPGPADRIAVVGGGIVGVLVGRLCTGLPGTRVTLVDIVPSRAALARTMGMSFAAPDSAPPECDVVFHASGSGAGLATALRLAGEEAAIVDLSWYGAGDVSVPLGEAFHSRRLRLVSSQVGKIAPSHRPRWTHRGRLTAALSLLADPALDALLTDPVPFDELPGRLPAIFAPEADARCPLIRYPAAATS